MFKFFLRMTKYRGFSRRQQKTLVDLLVKKHVNDLVCELINFFFIASPLVACLFFSLLERSMNNSTRIGLVIFALVYVLFMSWFLHFFAEEMQDFSYKISSKLYFVCCTQKGKALSKSDFSKISMKNPQLFERIQYGKDDGISYSVSFEILKTLEKGTLKFLAIRNIEPENGKKYILHVVYENNGWIYDTFSQRQYPLEKALKIYRAREVQDLYFEDISSYSYKYFVYLNGRKIKRWCAKHCVSQKLDYNSN